MGCGTSAVAQPLQVTPPLENLAAPQRLSPGSPLCSGADGPCFGAQNLTAQVYDEVGPAGVDIDVPNLVTSRNDWKIYLSLHEDGMIYPSDSDDSETLYIDDPLHRFQGREARSRWEIIWQVNEQFLNYTLYHTRIVLHLQERDARSNIFQLHTKLKELIEVMSTAALRPNPPTPTASKCHSRPQSSASSEVSSSSSWKAIAPNTPSKPSTGGPSKHRRGPHGVNSPPFGFERWSPRDNIPRTNSHSTTSFAPSLASSLASARSYGSDTSGASAGTAATFPTQ